MKATYALSRSSIVVGETTQLSLVVRFGAEPKADAERRKLNLSLVLDRSGSMAGYPLKQAIKAAQALVDELSAGDRLSVVIYDDDVETIVAPELVKNKTKIEQLIGKVTAGGCTNLSGGWLEGCKHVQKHASKELVNRVLLLTDGQANKGITNDDVLIKTARQKSEEGVVTTTLGFGPNFNEDLLIGMARAAEGNFYFIESPDDVAQVFKIELEGLSSVVAQNLSATARPNESVEHASVLNKYPIEKKGNDLEVTVGDVYAVEDKVLALDLDVRPEAEGPLEVATISYSYQAVVEGVIETRTGQMTITVNAVAAGKEAETALDLAVVGEASRLKSARTKDEAVELADRGNLSSAAKKLRQMAEQLRKSALSNQFEFAEEIEQLEHFAARLEKKSYDSVVRKELRDQSYQAGTRSRADLAQRGVAGGSAAGLAIVTSADGGVMLRCVKEGGKLRMRVVSDGYDATKNVQFPRAIRQEGVTYLVDHVVPSSDGSFYRAEGNIRRLLRPGETAAPAKTTAGRRAAAPAKAPKTASELPTTIEVGAGVIVQCVAEGSKLRARVVSDGYDPSWNIRFPRSIRALNVLYVVDQVVEAGAGGSYVAQGEIKRLLQ